MRLYGAKIPTDRPHGQQSITDRMIAGSRMVDEGTSVADVARTYNVSVATVYRWREKVKAARDDAKNLRRVR